MSHTPGPWYVGTLNDALFIINRPPRPSHDDMADIKDVQVIAKLNNCKGDDDAALLAASPELLDAAKTILDTLHSAIDAAVETRRPVPVFIGIAQLDAAIKKAERSALIAQQGEQKQDQG